MESDAALLGALLDMEHSTIAAYSAGRARSSAAGLATRGPSSSTSERTPRRSRGPSGASAGGAAAEPARVIRVQLPAAAQRRDALAFALDVETTAISAYADAIGKFATPPLRGLAASILTTEAEHAAVVLGELHRPQVPAGVRDRAAAAKGAS